MTPYVAGERRANALKLSSNENPLGPSPLAIEAAKQAMEESHIYPDGAVQALKDAVASYVGVDSGMIIPGNGSDEVLTMIAATYFNPGDRVLIGEHTFSQYAFAARLFDASISWLPMPDLRLQAESILEAVKHGATPTKAVFICTPNNPTGIAFSKDELRTVLEGVPKETLVVIDHAYQEYATGEAVADATHLVRRYPNLIVLRTFSKIFGLATSRVGCGVAHPDRIAEIEHVRLPFNVNGWAQAAAIAAVTDTTFVERSLAVNRSGKARMQQLLEELGLQALPTEANFLCIALPDAYPGDAKAAAETIAHHGVTVRALNSFGLPRYLRITIGTDPQIDVLERGLRAMVDSDG